MALTLVVNTNTWISLADAEIYFAGRLGADIVWKTGAEKEKSLVTAYNQLKNCGEFEIPSVITDVIKNAQCEQALFLLQQGNDIDARKALQAQGVVEAGIVKEKYGSDLDKVAICVNAKSFLEDYKITQDGLFIVDAKRDEELEADEIISEDNP